MSTALSNDIGTAVVASIGRLLAFAILLTALTLGLAAILAAAPDAYLGAKIVGAAFLVWIGIRMARAPVGSDCIAAKPRPLASLLREEFAIAFTNPKAILFFTAVAPPFIDRTAPFAPQIALLAVAFFALEVLPTTIYAIAGKALAKVVTDPAKRVWINRGGGTALIASAVILLQSAPPIG
jgi:threonine/homoserine/homoserine lactone efflux protein